MKVFHLSLGRPISLVPLFSHFTDEESEAWVTCLQLPLKVGRPRVEMSSCSLPQHDLLTKIKTGTNRNLFANIIGNLNKGPLFCLYFHFFQLKFYFGGIRLWILPEVSIHFFSSITLMVEIGYCHELVVQKAEVFGFLFFVCVLTVVFILHGLLVWNERRLHISSALDFLELCLEDFCSLSELGKEVRFGRARESLRSWFMVEGRMCPYFKALAVYSFIHHPSSLEFFCSKWNTIE